MVTMQEEIPRSKVIHCNFCHLCVSVCERERE